MFNNCQILIINLDKRIDRWAEVVREMRRMGITNYARFAAVPGGVLGCAVSYHECLKSGEGDILILEDDVTFEDTAQEIIPKAMKQLPEDYDIFYIGANVKKPAQRYSENLFKSQRGVHATHAVYYSAKGRKLTAGLFSPETEKMPIDHWLWLKGLKLLNCYICYPIQAFQRPGYSDLRLDYYDYRQEMLKNQKKNMK